ncbi:MAG: pilus assembly protein [Bryobacteraceae bacterium]|nr:pilus assembly protein [Bryobacteraceae bacterium]
MRRRAGSEKGNALVEFAISATLLVTLFAGIFQFAYTFYLYNELTNAVRAGTRYASLAKISNMGDGSLPPTFQSNVRNIVVYGSPSPAMDAKPVVPGLRPQDVEVQIGFDSRLVPRAVTVRITRLTINAVFRQFTLTNKPVLNMPFFGQYCPTGC